MIYEFQKYEFIVACSRIVTLVSVYVDRETSPNELVLAAGARQRGHSDHSHRSNRSLRLKSDGTDSSILQQIGISVSSYESSRLMSWATGLRIVACHRNDS